MAWRLARCLDTLRTQVNQAYPNRNKASDGTIGDSAHASTVSQHNPNSAGVVTAMDITHDPGHGADMNKLKEQLIKDSRTWYVIFNRRIWETGIGWKNYYGSNPHDKHLHISTKQTSNYYDNANKWNIGGEEMKIEDAPNWYGRCNKTMQMIRGRSLGRTEFVKYAVGHEFLKWVEAVEDNSEADKYYALGQWAKANKTKVEQQVASLTAEVNALKAGQKITPEEQEALAKKAEELAKSIRDADN